MPFHLSSDPWGLQNENGIRITLKKIRERQRQRGRERLTILWGCDGELLWFNSGVCERQSKTLEKLGFIYVLNREVSQNASSRVFNIKLFRQFGPVGLCWTRTQYGKLFFVLFFFFLRGGLWVFAFRKIKNTRILSKLSKYYLIVNVSKNYKKNIYIYWCISNNKNIFNINFKQIWTKNVTLNLKVSPE